MKRFAMAVGLGAGLLLVAGQADAQWRYTDDKGASRVTQYKLDIPTPHRDAAEWIGPIGIGKPELSADQIRAAQRWDAIQRIVAAEAGLLQYKSVIGPGAAARGSGRRPAPRHHVHRGRAPEHDLPGHLEGRRRVLHRRLRLLDGLRDATATDPSAASSW